MADFDKRICFRLVSVFRGRFFVARKILWTYFVPLTSHSNEIWLKRISKVKLIMNSFGTNREYFLTHDWDQNITKYFFHFSILKGLLFVLTKDIMDIFRPSDFF